MGLARGARLLRDVVRGAEVAHADVELAAPGAAAGMLAQLSETHRHPERNPT